MACGDLGRCRLVPADDGALADSDSDIDAGSDSDSQPHDSGADHAGAQYAGAQRPGQPVAFPDSQPDNRSDGDAVADRFADGPAGDGVTHTPARALADRRSPSGAVAERAAGVTRPVRSATTIGNRRSGSTGSARSA